MKEENTIAKRFVDTEIWEQDWYLELPLKYMKFWDYITAKCNHAGVFKLGKKIFEGVINDTIDFDEALKLFNNGKERVAVLKNGKWLLTGFIVFQQGTKLNLNNPFHLSIYKLLLDDKIDIKQIRGLGEVSERSLRPHSNSNSYITKKNKTIDIPSILDTKEFREIWDMWVNHRKEKRVALKDTTIKMQLKKLEKWGLDKSILSIKNSIEQGYTGLFEPRNNKKEGERDERWIKFDAEMKRQEEEQNG